MKKENHRRKFIDKGLRSLTKMMIENKLPEGIVPERSKVKMLTPDGKLVEVDPDTILNTKKVNNKDILSWMEKSKT